MRVPARKGGGSYLRERQDRPVLPAPPVDAPATAPSYRSDVTK